MSEAPKLKPCPFCGQKVQIRTFHDELYGDTHVLIHDNSGAQILCVLYRGLTWNGSEKEFALLWNRRAE